MVSSTPRPHFTPGKAPVPILQEAGWAPGPVWTAGKSRPHRDSIPDCPARSSVAIPTELPFQWGKNSYRKTFESEYDSGSPLLLQIMHETYLCTLTSTDHYNSTKCAAFFFLITVSCWQLLIADSVHKC